MLVRTVMKSDYIVSPELKAAFFYIESNLVFPLNEMLCLICKCQVADLFAHPVSEECTDKLVLKGYRAVR